MPELPEPIANHPEIEAELVPVVSAQVRAVIEPLLDLLSIEPVRALYLIEKHAASQREMLAELTASKNPSKLTSDRSGMLPYTGLGDPLGGLGGFMDQITDMVQGPIDGQRLTALMRARKMAREQEDFARADRIDKLIDGTLDHLEDPDKPDPLGPEAEGFVSLPGETGLHPVAPRPLGPPTGSLPLGPVSFGQGKTVATGPVIEMGTGGELSLGDGSVIETGPDGEDIMRIGSVDIDAEDDTGGAS